MEVTLCYSGTRSDLMFLAVAAAIKTAADICIDFCRSEAAAAV